MRRLTAFSALTMALVSSCATAPPERGSLPDVADALDPPVACAFLVGEPKGIAVSEVMADTAAEGVLEAGDVIVAVNGVATMDTDNLREVLDEQVVGEEIEIDLVRNGADQSVSLTLGANPDDPERVYIGVMIRTEYQQVPASEADDQIGPAPTARSLTIGGTLFGGDPTLGAWSNTGLLIESDSNWVSTTEGVYSLESGGDGALLEITSDDPIDYDLTEEWTAVRLIGSIDEDLLIAATSPVPDDPELVSVGLVRLDPASGETEWVVGITEGFGVPISAWGSPDSGLIAIAGVEADNSQVTGVEILDANGAGAGFEDLLSLGTPIGWLDAETALFRTSATTASGLNALTGDIIEFDLDPTLETSPIFAVADGHSVLAVTGRSLVLDDLAAATEVRVLAENCTVHRVGETGWAP